MCFITVITLKNRTGGSVKYNSLSYKHLRNYGTVQEEETGWREGPSKHETIREAGPSIFWGTVGRFWGTIDHNYGWKNEDCMYEWKSDSLQRLQAAQQAGRSSSVRLCWVFCILNSDCMCDLVCVVCCVWFWIVATPCIMHSRWMIQAGAHD